MNNDGKSQLKEEARKLEEATASSGRHNKSCDIFVIIGRLGVWIDASS